MNSQITDILLMHLKSSTHNVFYAITDKKNTLLFCSELFSKILNNPKNLIGKDISDMLPFEFLAKIDDNNSAGTKVINGIPFEIFIYNLHDKTLFIGEKSLIDHGNIVATLSKMTDDLTNMVREVNKKKNELTNANQQITKLMNTDTLTNLHNRRYFFEAIKTYDQKQKDLQTEGIIIVMADIDDFKSVNDNYGHAFGDNVLVELAQILSESIRKNDIVARFGGEEFIICIFSSEIKNALNIAERIRKEFENTVFEHKDLKVTASFGVALAKEDEEIASVIKRADDALYKSKKEGKNKVTFL